MILAVLMLSGAASVRLNAQTLNAADATSSTSEDVVKRIAISGFISANVTGGVSPYSLLTVSGANNGTVSIDTGTSEIVFTPTAHFSGTASFTYIVQDSTSTAPLSDSGTVTVTVNPISDTPTLTVQSATGDEDTGIFLNINLTQTDTDFSETLSVKIENIPTGASLDNSNHDVPTITANAVTLSHSQLSGLSIKSPANDDTDFTLNVTGISKDGSATAVNHSATPASLAVTVRAVSDTPTLTVDNASGNEDTEISLSITVIATDSSETLSVTISNIPNGASLLDGTTPISISNSSATLTSSQLSALKIRPPSNSDTDFALSVQASSKDSDPAIPASTEAKTLNVLVNPVNDAPSFTKGPDITLEEDAPSQFHSNWATAISPGGNEFGQVLTFQVTIPTSAASLFSVAPSITPEGHLIFTTAPNANSSAVTVTVALKDNGGTATTGSADTSASQTFTITVTPVNDAPRVTAPFQQSLKEDTTLVFAAGNNNLISITDPDAGSVARLSLSVQNGKINFSTTTGLTFLNTSGSTSTPVTQNNSANIVVEGTLSALNAALAGNASSPGLSYTPDSEFNGFDTLVIVANDLASTSEGGNLRDTKTININVTPVNDTPVISNTTPTFTVPENSPPGFAVGSVSATDADPGSSLNFVITSGNLGGVFNMNSSSGEISVAGKLDFEPLPTDKKYVLTVLAADNGIPSLSASATVTINVSDVNEPPHMARQVFSVNENLTTGSTIGSLVSTDPDTTTPNSTRNHAIVSGNEDNKFALSSAGVLTLNAALDFETRSFYELNVSVTDGGSPGLSHVAPIAINIIDNNETPIISPQTFTVDENAPIGTFVGNVVAVDPDAGHRTKFSITAGNTDNKFGIDLVTGQITVRGNLNFEATPSYSLTAKAEDNADASLFSTATVTINVVNLNEIPIINVPRVNNVPALQTVAEDGTLTFTGSDATPGNRITISDDSGNNSIELTLKVEHGTLKLATGPTFETLSGGDNTGRMRIRAKVADLNTLLNGLQYKPELDFNGEDFLELMVDDLGASGAGGPFSTLSGIPIRVQPAIDGAPNVTGATTPFGVLSTEGLTIERNPLDGPEVSHFKITDITGGRLFQRDGRTEIANGNFINAFEARDGLRFLPNSIAAGSFKVQASLNDNPNGSGLGGTQATVTITVVKAQQFINFPPIQGVKTFRDPAFLVSATASSGLSVQFQVSGPMKIVTHVAVLNGASERPTPVTTPATGAAVAVLEGSQLTFQIAYQGLSGVANGAHIHGPADANGTAGVMIDLQSFAIGGFGTAGEIEGTVTLNSDQLSAISSGQTYINIHTAANGGGEIRGQLVVPTSTSGKLLMITGAGIVNVTALQPGDDRYNPAPSAGHFITVFKANQTINFAPISGKVYGDASFNAPANSSAGLPVKVEVSSGPAVLGTDGNVQILGAGFVTLVAGQDGNENFHPAQSAFQSFNVARATLNINVNSATRSFGQSNPTFSGTFSGLRNNDSITVNYSTFATPNSPPGSYDIFPTFQDPAGKLQNYSLNITRGTLTVTANQPPAATAQTVSTDEDTPKSITLGGTDAENANLTFSIVQGPQHGTLSPMTGTPPSVTYTPALNYNGPDSFTFRVRDQFQESPPGTVTINVNAVNDPPAVRSFSGIGLRPSGPVITVPLGDISPGPQDEQAQTVTVEASSGDTTKVTVQGVDQPTASQTGGVRIQPVAGVTSGSALITVIVTDTGSPPASTSRTFNAIITPRVLRLVNTTGLAGAQVAVPLELVAQGNENTFGLSVDFDETKISFASVVLGSDTSGTAVGANLQINSSHAAEGQVGFALALPADQVFAAGTKQVALLNFNIPIDAQEETTRIRFAPFPVSPEVVDAQAARVPVAVEGADLAISLGFEADVTPAPFGNNTGQVTATDWTKVGIFAIHLENPSSPSEFRRADCAPKESLGDGVISLADWTQAGRYAAGLDLTGTGTAATVPKAGGSSGSNQGATGAQGLNSGGSNVALKSSGRVTRSIRLHDRRVQRGQNFIVLASVDARGDENTLGFSLKYDPRAVRFVGARLTGEAQGATLLTNDREQENGRIGLAFALPAGKSLSVGRGAVLELEFSSSPSATEAISLVQLADAPVRREVVSVTADELRANYSDATVTIQSADSPVFENRSDRNLSVVDRAPAGEMMLRLNGVPGSQVVIETSTDLVNWTPLRTVTVSNGQAEFVDPDAKHLPGRFYRVRPVR
ncbi:MAG: cadherin domain-containing protein [Verrucomicrobia bacterium]|nr:cadherin domain-containing protein [Verrucomicrobiota bacterium]